MGFLESFTQLLGAVYNVVASVFGEKPPRKPIREETPRPKLEVRQRDNEVRRTPEAGPTPTGYVADGWIQNETWKAQIGVESTVIRSDSEPLLSFGEIQVGVWNCWAVPRCPESFVLVYGCPKPQETVWRNGFPYPDEDQHVLWFHGTDYESALSIIRDGIDLGRGKGHQDFSHRDGFYLSPDFQSARRWACRREKPAVIAFKIRLRCRQGLNLNPNRNAWEAIIKFNRSGREFVPATYVGRDELIELHNCDYMIGPVNGGKGGPRSEDGDWENWTPSGFNGPYEQLCVRSEAMARDLGDGNNIESVIIY